MFPYRRGGKKRGKGGGPPAPQQQQQRRFPDAGGRRPAGSVFEVLPQLQPTTKALAQLLAGNVRPSGQLGQARSLLALAERLAEERQADRLSPGHREEFYEQLARLKLTLADADDLADEAPEEDVEARPSAPPLSAEKLRSLALSLAASTAEPAPRPVIPPIELAGDDAGGLDLMPGPLSRVPPPPRLGDDRTDIPQGSPRNGRLRLRDERTTRAKPAADAG